MDARLTTLASGSGGNASLLEVNGFGLLIDCGLHPRTLAARLAAIGSSWNAIHAVVLTHTHGDHWKDATLARMRALHIPLFAHEAHFDHLNGCAPSFDSLHRGKLTRPYSGTEPFMLSRGLTCTPFAVPHDADPTFAFRIEHHDDAGDGPAWSVGHASDLGIVPDGLADAFAGVDVLAVEFNHDVELQRSSARPAHLIRRVLGDHGHLSNRQAGAFAAEVAARSGDAAPWCLIQLHLSRECNTPALAVEAGRDTLAPFRRQVSIVTAKQDVPARTIPLARRPSADTRVTRSTVRPHVATDPFQQRPVQPQLPGFEV